MPRRARVIRGFPPPAAPIHREPGLWEWTRIKAPAPADARMWMISPAWTVGNWIITGELLLQQRVIDELEFEPNVSVAHIGMSSGFAVVTLGGHVGSYMEKYAAERAVHRVRGVKAAAMEFDVRLPQDRKLADDEIAERAVHMLN